MQQTVKKHATHAFSQFRLTNNLLQNLNKYELTPTAKLVLLYLSACYNPNKADIFPKQKTIAAKLGVSERSVVRAVQELVKAGLIIIECKYTNRYKFTSQIVSKQAINEKIFEPEKMSDDLRQNDTQKSDKLSPAYIEPMNEHIKQPQNVEEYKILKLYALHQNARNIHAYVHKLIASGSADKIIDEYKQSRTNAAGMLAKAVKVQNDLKYAKANRADAIPQCWYEMKKQILQNVTK